MLAGLTTKLHSAAGTAMKRAQGNSHSWPIIWKALIWQAATIYTKLDCIVRLDTFSYKYSEPYPTVFIGNRKKLAGELTDIMAISFFGKLRKKKSTATAQKQQQLFFLYIHQEFMTSHRSVDFLNSVHDEEK